MKKVIIILFIMISLLVLLNERKNILIPDNAIRFRILANSNSEIDQELKMKVKNEVQSEIYKLTKDTKNIDSARKILNNNIDKIDNIVKKYNVDYSINYGNNYFPEKEYKGIKYNEGEYESLVIKLGSASGDNWWCVLFPPLCLLDDNNYEDNEYSLYVTKILDIFN